MSTILKALRRLEKERPRGDLSLHDEIAGPADDEPTPRARPRRWPILAASAGVGVLAGVVVLLLFFRGDLVGRAPEPAPGAADAGAPATLGSEAARAARRAAAERAMRQLAERSRAPAAPAPAAPPPAFAEVEPEVAPPPPGPPPAEPDVAVIERGAPAPRIADDAPVVPSPDPAAAAVAGRFSPHDPDGPNAPGGPAPEVVAELQRAAAAAPVPAAVPERAPAPAVASAPTAAAAPEPAAPVAREPERAAAAPEAPAPRPAARPAEPSFPSLRVERTTWHPAAERRVAVVALPDGDSREVREGDRVEGARVEKIEPSGVVFEYRGRAVRRGLAPGS